ncbi:magnesium transporter CorA family protein [Peribacillus psychrosaccharolyticus]|uniref:Magnesium transporter CorA family protein n=1 Tax=Peribacillus psychrosaccharolyticus TaxID=1407 RepID=A0A974S1L8_PERPY|nr:magnesium transporter CorA family protein [Peribacillus psychrosaccharolyticus]MEC2056445.1 magnesium transporter CorA family protein [Peribacillus psychrosaccharolyticus]MED3745419.1 magnesium transporter CorA family protein [Peribacillus psychrosaccharolyticus]QQT00400.1 magnesium transporter CorA family protein [Peribacillus psychrosaccharolyticus]
MIEIYKTTEPRQIENLTKFEKGCWIHLTAPTEDEIQQIVKTLDLPENFIKDPLDDEERPRIEREEKDVLIIVDYPYLTHDETGTPVYETIPIGLIFTEDYFLTVSLKDSPILTNFKNNKIKSFYTNKKTRFALQILSEIASFYLRYLKQVNKITNDTERKLHQSMKNKELYTFLGLEKSLVYFTTSLKSNKVVLDKILRFNYLKMYEEDKDLLEDVIIETNQAIEMSETYSSILSGMMDAFASIISNNVNIAMKFLTSVTIILTLPTMVASFFGMNVNLPFSHHPHAFAITLTIAAGLASATAFFFWKKKYF